MKKTLRTIGILLLLLLVFRGSLYRFLISYRAIGTRTEIKITNSELIAKIESKTKGRVIDLKQIIDVSYDITLEELQFTTEKTSNNPNELIHTNHANCIGYAAMFNSIANYLIQKNGLNHQLEAKHKIGRLDVWGVDLHSFFKSPFFRDHDFNQITDLRNGNSISIDPSMSDYLWIKTITLRTN